MCKTTSKSHHSWKAFCVIFSRIAEEYSIDLSFESQSESGYVIKMEE